MTPEAQRIAIAEACGWTRAHATDAREDGIVILDRRFNGFKRRLIRWNQVRIYGGWDDRPGFHQIDIDESNGISTEELLRDYDLPEYWRKGDTITRHLPNYLTDLNAMHEAVALLNYNQLCEFGRYLSDTVLGEKPAGFDYGEHDLACIANATAAQRAEAFLRTLNLWKD